MVTVPKPNGKLRMCVDFKTTLNKHLKVDQHPIPSPEDILNKFVGCKSFCRLDLPQAYLQLEVHDSSKSLLVVILSKDCLYTLVCLLVWLLPVLFFNQ